MPDYVFGFGDAHIVIAGWKVYVGGPRSVYVYPVTKWMHSSRCYHVICDFGGFRFPKPCFSGPCTYRENMAGALVTHKLEKVRRGSSKQREVVSMLTEREGIEPPGVRWQPGGPA